MPILKCKSTTFSWNGTAVGSVRKATIPGSKVEVLDATVLDSPHKEKDLSDLVDFGASKLTLAFADTLPFTLGAKGTAAFAVTDSGGTVHSASFYAGVSEIGDVSVEPGQQLLVDITLEKIAATAPSSSSSSSSSSST